MSSEIYFKQPSYKNKSTSKKSKQNYAKDTKNKNNNQKERQKYSNQKNFKKNIPNNNNFIKSNYIKNNQFSDVGKNENEFDENNYIKPNKNHFISISEIPKTDEDNIYDNFDYLKEIQKSIMEKEKEKLNIDPKKIKTVDANKYLNNQNNLISTFNDFKQKLLNKDFEFNSPFIFYRNNVDLSTKKKLEEEKNYQIKKYRYLRAFRYSFNPEIRRKNSKIIQNWWRKKIKPKIEKRKKIIKIQSAFRGYITRKTLNDIICISVLYQNFINKLRHALGSYVHRNYFPKRYYKKKYALEKIFPLKLKLFFRRWKNIHNIYAGQEKAAKFLFKNRQQKRYLLLVLKTFFKIWRLKCEQFGKNEDKITSMKDQNRKLSALSKLFNKLEKIGKKSAFNSSKENILKYLKNIFQNKTAKKLMELYNKYNLRRNLKKYFDLWRKHNMNEKERNLKLKLLANEIKAKIRKNDKDYIRNNLNNLRSKVNLQTINDLKKAKKQFLFPEGCKHITNCVRKNIIRLIFKDYIRKRNIMKKLLKLIQKRFLKYYMNKWKRLSKDLLYKDKCKNHLKKIILKFCHLSNNINLAKYFNKWKNKVFMNKHKDQKIDKYNKFCNSLEKYIMNKNKNILNHKKFFLKKKLSTYINTDGSAIKKKLLKCIKNYTNKEKFLKLKKAFDKWKKYVHFCQLNDLKGKNLKSVSKLTKIISDTKILSKNLHEWKDKNNLVNLKNENALNDNIINSVNILNGIKNKRKKELFNSMRIAKDRLMKKIILKNILKKYPKKLLSKYFNKWKINTLKLQNKYKLKNLDKINKLKDITNNKIKNQEIKNYGALKKYLYKWFFISKLINKENKTQFLKNIRKSLSIITSVTTGNALKNSFNLIKSAEVNTKNNALKRIKKYFISNDKKNLRKAFYEFLKKAQYDNKNIMKSNIIYNLKLKNEQMRDRTLLTKYFNKWRMLNNIYIKERNNSTTLINNKIKKIFKRIKEKEFLKNMKKIKHDYYIKGFSKKLFDLYNLIEKRIKYKYLKKWKNNSKKMSSLLEQREKGYKIIYKTLSKAYSYKKLEEVLLPILVNNYKKRYQKDFFDKFKQFFLKKNNSSYKVLLKNGMIPKKINFKFKKTIKPNYPIYNIQNNEENKNQNKEKEENESLQNSKKRVRYQKPRTFFNRKKLNFEKEEVKPQAKNIVLTNSIDKKKDKFYNERLIPYLVTYLNELRLNRLRLVFNYFNYIKRNKLFCMLYNSWAKKQNYIYKKNLIKSLKYSKTKKKIINIMRRYIIHKIMTKYLVITKKRNDLLTMVYKTKVFKKINRIKKTVRFLRIWRVYTKLLRDRAAQIEKFEKSFSETYEKLSDSVFVDNADEKSVQTQVINFLDKINNEEKAKLKNNLGVSQSSLNSYFSGKIINNNEILNASNNYFTFHNEGNENDNDSNISFSNFCGINNENEDKSVSNSINNSNNQIKNIKSTLFIKNSKKK